jgi:fucose 4-O-acetylase-like acetyltransferase
MASLTPPVAALRAPGSPRSGLTGSRAIEVDALRGLATLGVVWVHVAEYQGRGPSVSCVGRFGTAFYTAAAVFVALHGIQRRQRLPGWATVGRRAHRLLFPFLVWSLIYGVFHLQYGLRMRAPWSEITRYWGPASGTAPHLWFLPFAFLVALLTLAVGRRLLKMPGRWLVVGVLVLVPTAYWVTYGYALPSLNRDWLVGQRLHRVDRWLEEAPVVLASLGVVALWLRSGERWVAGLGRGGRGALAGVLGMLFVLSELVFVVHGDALRRLSQSDARFVAHAGGLALLGLALAVGGRPKLVQAMARLGKHTYTIFLSHFFVIELANRVWWRLPGFGSLVSVALSSLGVFGICLAFSMYGPRVVRLLTHSRPVPGPFAARQDVC